MIRNLVFDWAGTLLDDGALTWSATNAVLCEFGAESVSRATFEEECQAPVTPFYTTRIPDASMDEIDQKFNESYAAGLSEISMREGARETLMESHASGRLLFICSTLSADVIRGVLEAQGLAGIFTAIIGGAVEKSSALSQILVDHGLESDETLMCGDSPHDIEAGIDCHVATVALLGGQGSEAALRAATPEHVFASHEDLMEFLRLDRAKATGRLVIPTVGGFIINGATAHVLLVRTRKWSGRWGLPGGKIDVGESMEDAWHREAREEVGLELTDTKFLMLQDSIFSEEFIDRRHFLLINYVSRAMDPSVLKLNHEIAESAWVLPEDARSFDLNEPTRAALEFAQRKGLLEVKL